jgi:deoxyadenosine kinase
MFIGVSGLIGAGKSTLTRDLALELEDRHRKARGMTIVDHAPLHWKAVYEPVKENPYLEDFYLNIERWTFNMQMFLLARRFQQHQEVVWDPVHRKGGGVVQDRTIYEDTIFARMHHDDGLMVGRDWETYSTHFHVMQAFLRYPDVILYLRVSPSTALRRIQERARSEEQGKVPLAYLEALYEGYEEFTREMARYTVVIPIEWEDYAPVEQVADLIKETLDGSTPPKYLRDMGRVL